jgi:hypothetical protein
MDKLRTFLKQYSLDDLARSVFVLNLWLPNIASPIKSQYLYILIEEIGSELPKEAKIRTYADFVEMCGQIVNFIPSFPMIEDYVPEADWGHIKYFFKKRFYQIFYGGDLSNAYDFYYSFEIIHKWFDEYYLKLIKRSALAEFKFALELQDHILKDLKQDFDADTTLSAGDFNTPSEVFWSDANSFIDNFRPEKVYSPELVSLYTYKCDSPGNIQSLDKFSDLSSSFAFWTNHSTNTWLYLGEV